MAEDKIEIELKQLQLEQTRHEVSVMRSAQEMRRTRVRSIEASLAADAQRREAVMAACSHRKGGKDHNQIYRGNDSNYAVVKHQLPTGPIIVVCQRCPKVWRAPDRALIAKGASAEDRKRYARELKEYNDAMDFPTDNEMSGSQLFSVVNYQELSQAV
jgi:hypothetical protein